MGTPYDFLGLQGLVRKFIRGTYGENAPAMPAMNNGGDLLIAQALPERSELVRLGYSFSAQMPAASAWTLLITIPTTLSSLALQNGEPTGGKSYIIDRFWIKAVTSMASACWLTPLSQVVPPGTALVADNAAVLRLGLSGSGIATGRTRSQLVMASTATGCLLDKWNHHAGINVSPTTNIAATVEVQCYGKYIIPPGGSFNVSAQESVSGGTAICGIEWHEVQLDVS